MIRPLLFGIVILIAGATQVTAQGVPNFKVEQGCREVSTGPNKLTTFDKCMEDERSAQRIMRGEFKRLLSESVGAFSIHIRS